MTYSHYVMEMNMKFPHHRPMDEEDFNAMVRTEKEGEIKSITTVREGCKRLFEPTLERYTHIESAPRTVRKNMPTVKSTKKQSA